MTKYVAFLRAVNVAGHARVKMSDVRETFAAAGGFKVGTYLQSGNIVFESPARDVTTILKRVRTTLRGVLGEEPKILLRTVRELERLVRESPFTPRHARSTAKLYLTLLSRQPPRRPTLALVSRKEALEVVAMTDREVFIVSRRKKNGFYGFPNNFIEKELGVPTTSRNWSTVTKLLDFARRETAP